MAPARVPQHRSHRSPQGRSWNEWRSAVSECCPYCGVFVTHAQEVVCARSEAPRERARLVPMRIWRDVRSALAASGADDAIFAVGEPDMVRPLSGADRDRVAALVI